MIPRAFKLKCYNFLNKEQAALDKGELNIEDAQSIEAEESQEDNQE